jgi:uncharacterized protein YjbI with pentapeptide repeats
VSRLASHTYIRKLTLSVGAIVISAVVVGLLALISYKDANWPAWTGFGTDTVMIDNNKGQFTVIRQPRKTLWDMLSLLIVPAMLAGGAYWLNESAKRRDRMSEERKAQEATLQSYLDKITELLIKSPPLSEKSPETDKVVARSRTLTALSTLNGERKGTVIRFLYESGLIRGEKPVVDLNEANLREIVLTRADLHGVNLKRAKLSDAQLAETNLTDADLSDADLSQANLKGAILHGVKLPRANLTGAILTDANFHTSALTQKEIESLPPEQALVHSQKSDAQLTQFLDTRIHESREELERLNREEAREAFRQLLEQLDNPGERLPAGVEEVEGKQAEETNRSTIRSKEDVVRSLAEKDRQATRSFEQMRDLLDKLKEAEIKLNELSRADLHEAILARADLRGASLRRANLRNANLTEARLQGANLSNANLWSATLDNADLRGAVLNDLTVSDEQLATARSVKGAWRNASRLR